MRRGHKDLILGLYDQFHIRRCAQPSSLDPTLAAPAAQRIDRQNQQQHRQNHRAALGLLEQAEADIKHLAQAAGADEAQHAGLSLIHI